MTSQISYVLRKGDRVTIKPEFDGDDTIFHITEWNWDRGFIQPLVWKHGGIRPTELVSADMIELVKTTNN